MLVCYTAFLFATSSFLNSYGILSATATQAIYVETYPRDVLVPRFEAGGLRAG